MSWAESFTWAITEAVCDRVPVPGVFKVAIALRKVMAEHLRYQWTAGQILAEQGAAVPRKPR
jgi:hypothetical protein